MYSQIVERTPSVYFKFDDESHRNLSKSSFALDYSISNQKQALSNRLAKLRSGNKTTFKHQQTNYNLSNMSPLHTSKTLDKQQPNNSHLYEQDEFMALHRCQKQSPNTKKQNKLKTQDFFDQFDKKYCFTFEQDDIRTHEFIPQASYEGSSKISRGFLDFQQFEVEQTMKLIQIDSKNIMPMQTHHSAQLVNDQQLASFVKTSLNTFASTELTANNYDEKTQKKPIKPHLSNQTSQQPSSAKQNCAKKDQTSFQEVVSFGPTAQIRKARKYKASNSRHFITKDFQNNSSLLEKSNPIIEPKRKLPFKNIQNLISKHCKAQAKSQTRKKPIINTDLLVSTINKTEKNQVKQTNNAWSNPVNRKSSSLECTFNYDNMFKTNAFRETLKSTTLQNWKKKYHKKIENLGEKKTVSKKYRGHNIFENLFIRA